MAGEHAHRRVTAAVSPRVAAVVSPNVPVETVTGWYVHPVKIVDGSGGGELAVGSGSVRRAGDTDRLLYPGADGRIENRDGGLRVTTGRSR
jgi:hypothetical protein